MSPKESLNMLRTERAAKLLRATDLSLEKVAVSSGFFSAGRLNAVFRDQYGTSPSQYGNRRRRARSSRFRGAIKDKFRQSI
jgi:AraC family transcriptional regulator of arabinose operon